MKRILNILALALVLVVVGQPTTASAQDMYEVKITNLTPGQAFTPFLLMTHSPDMSIFIPGTMASAELRAIAEGGNTMPMMETYMGMMGVMDVVGGDSMTTPGVTTASRRGGRRGSREAPVGLMAEQKLPLCPRRGNGHWWRFRPGALDGGLPDGRVPGRAVWCG